MLLKRATLAVEQATAVLAQAENRACMIDEPAMVAVWMNHGLSCAEFGPDVKHSCPLHAFCDHAPGKIAW